MSARVLVFVVGFALYLPALQSGTLIGYLRDQNWYARYQNNAPGVGYYEFAINGNATNFLTLGASTSTGIFGEFTNTTLTTGSYTIASWDVWWRSAYAFNVALPAGISPRLDLRLKATMWGYADFWDNTGYTEFGQTFVATGPISMIYLRIPGTTGPTYTLTVHESGPGGPQIGEARSFGVGDQRPIYGWGQMPTVAGRNYYARLRSSTPGVITQMDPRPDFSDPMPGGCLWVGPAGNVQPQPDRDLGLVIMSDDDGLITDMYTRSSGSLLSGSSVGQTFTARGVNLISVALWPSDPANPQYQVTIRETGPSGNIIGTAKRGRPARVTADPEMIVTWAPGECPLNPGAVYYVELTRVDGANVNAVMANSANPYAYGQAYQSGVALAASDLAGTIMEEAGPGSALMPAVKFISDPQVLEIERGTKSIVVRWSTDVAADSKVEFAVENPPYNLAVHDPAQVTSHALTLPNLKPHAMYHYRVTSTANSCRPGVSRDFVICTTPAQTNLLLNPGFEEGIVTNSATRGLTNWSATGTLDMKEARSGQWFGSLPAHSGQWLMQGALNGSTSDAYVFQRVQVTPGKRYTFSAWVGTWPRENGTWKYDVWNNLGGSRLIYMRLGIDPYGGNNPLASTVQWTPRMYSHMHYSNLAKTALAASGFLTVFISMKGDGEEWHLYGVDDCVLTETAVAQPCWTNPRMPSDGLFSAQIVGDTGVTNTVEVSTNLLDWSFLKLVLQTNAVTSFIDSPPPGTTNYFYRAVVR